MRLPPTLILLALLLPLSSGSAGAELSNASTSLEEALSAIELASIRRDVETIASDEMEGRDSPSSGLRATADYLAERLDVLGFEHGAPNGFFYEYPLSHIEIDPDRSRLVARKMPGGGDSEQPEATGTEIEFEFGTDWFIGRASDVGDWDLEGPVVYLGPSDELDLDGIELQGKWALVGDEGGTLRRLTERVQSTGALGMILVEEKKPRKTYAERFERTTKYLKRARANSLSRTPDFRGVFPRAYMTRTAAKRLFEAAGFKRPPSAGTPLELELSESRHLKSPGGRAFLSNVCGFWRGNDPELSNEVIVLSAHYDHVGRQGDEIWNGADDNASGTAGLLALAQALKTYGPMKRSILLLWVSAEERGLLGSEAWARRPWLPDGSYPIANINMDMISRNDPKELMLTPSKKLGDEYNGIAKLVERLARSEGFRRVKSADAYWERSDQVNFARHLDLPVAFLFCDVHEDYHRPTDTADKVDYDKLRRVTRLVMRVLESMQEEDLELSKREVPGLEEFRAKVVVGTALRELERIRAATDAWQSYHGGKLPAELSELVGFEAGGRTWFAGGVPDDPWGNAYRVSWPSEGNAGVFESLGSDGVEGGSGLAADIRLP